MGKFDGLAKRGRRDRREKVLDEQSLRQLAATYVEQAWDSLAASAYAAYREVGRCAIVVEATEADATIKDLGTRAALAVPLEPRGVLTPEKMEGFLNEPFRSKMRRVLGEYDPETQVVLLVFSQDGPAAAYCGDGPGGATV